MLCLLFLLQLLIDSPVSPVTSILPLVFVITVTAIKQVCITIHVHAGLRNVLLIVHCHIQIMYSLINELGHFLSSLNENAR